MRAVDRLRRDHEILRTKLDVLEATLRMTPPTTWFILRELCYTLSRQLQDHIRREEELVAACRNSLSSEVQTHVRLEHDEEPQLLRTVNHLFIEEGGKAIEQIRGVLGELIPRLRRHMDEEEAELFPAIEEMLGDQEESSAQASSPAVKLHEEMTVNHILHAYPQTKRLLERLFINVPYEGYDCLDEVAWRRGMDCGQLFLLLEEAISVGCRCEETAAA
jgi:hemerythrin-like domain-containing protein